MQFAFGQLRLVVERPPWLKQTLSVFFLSHLDDDTHIPRATKVKDNPRLAAQEKQK